jgi:alkylhydroperoxidase family enzyme
MSRLPKATREDFPDDIKYVWDKLVRDPIAGGGEAMGNIFLAMGNNPRVLLAYLRMSNPLWAHYGLDVRTRELIILRCAILRHSVYEWHQHVRIGRQAGLRDAEINALHHWDKSDLFTEQEKAILAYTDALAETDHPSQVVYDGVASHLPPATIVGITLLAAFYFLTAKFLGAMEVEPESPFVGWELG